jgi:hypothetical protein
LSDFTVAIMQPYFFPYAGYFRLLAASDLFVIYDCVQFPRRGWVHRNKLVDASGEARWLTLPETEHILAALADIRGTPVDYIERLLEITAAYCGLPWRTVRSSSLNVPPELHGQDRILEIARRLGASHYVNAAGGRELYDPDVFDSAGIALRFLVDYKGPTASILQRILTDDRKELARDIVESAITT